MSDRDIIDHLKDILLEQKSIADEKVKNYSELEFTKIAYNNGVSDLSDRVLEFIFKYES